MLDYANVIESRERLAFIMDGQIAAGIVKKGSARAHIQKLRRVAYRRRAKPVSKSGLASMGIPVVMVKKKGGDDG